MLLKHGVQIRRWLFRKNSPKCYFASEGKIVMVLNAILPLEQWFFIFFVLLPLKYFEVYELSLPFFRNTATILASNPK